MVKLHLEHTSASNCLENRVIRYGMKHPSAGDILWESLMFVNITNQPSAGLKRKNAGASDSYVNPWWRNLGPRPKRPKIVDIDQFFDIDRIHQVVYLKRPVRRCAQDVAYVQSSARLCEPILRKMDEAPLRDGARVLGLYGMGGVGKTTICKVLHNQKIVEFGGKVLYRKVDTHVYNPTLGELSRQRLSRQKVFLILDGVNASRVEEAQRYLRLEYGCGSIILVTSQSLGVLERLGIRDGDCIEMPELEKEEAIKLFLFHAQARLPLPLNCTDQEIMERCVEACRFLKRDIGRKICTQHYHPLALKILGNLLQPARKTPFQWELRLNRSKYREMDLFKQPHEREHPIFRVLRGGYDSLPRREQQMFLDLALNVVPQSAWNSNSVWEWLSSAYGVRRDTIKQSLQALWRKGLIEDVREDGPLRIKIHDLFVEFAKEEALNPTGFISRFLFDVGGTYVPSELRPISRLDREKPFLLERLVIRNSYLRRLNDVFEYWNFNLRHLKVLQILDCNLLEEVDVQRVVNLRSLEICGCPRLGQKFQGIEKLTNLVWLSWKDLPKSSPVLDHLSSLASLQYVELAILPHSSQY